MENPIIFQGLLLMCVGMISVFAFLYILVWIMRGMGALIPHLPNFWPEVPEKKAPKAATAANDDAEIALAIAAATAASRK